MYNTSKNKALDLKKINFFKGEIVMISIGTLTMNSMDYVFIVDKNYTIVYDTRFDETMNNSSNEYLSSDVMGKNFFEAFPEFSTKDSSIVECMKKIGRAHV